MPDDRDELKALVMASVANHFDMNRTRYMEIEAEIERASTDAIRRILGGGRYARLAKAKGLKL